MPRAKTAKASAWAGLEEFRQTLPEYRRYEEYHLLLLRFDIVKAQFLISRESVDLVNLLVADAAKSMGMVRWVPPEGRDVASSLMMTGFMGPSDPDWAMLEMSAEEALRPLIIGTVRLTSGRQKGETVTAVIDGAHRLYRAWNKGVALLPAYRLTYMQTERIRI